jgi:hypothetical protein
MDIQTISIVLAGIGIFIAAINSVISSRQAAEERQRQAFMELYATYRNRDFRFYLHDLLWKRDVTTYAEYMKSETVEKMAGDNAVFAFYEGIGFFVKNGWLNIRDVEDLMAETIILVWERFEPFTQEMRSLWPRIWENYEYLYQQVKKVNPQVTIGEM